MHNWDFWWSCSRGCTLMFRSNLICWSSWSYWFDGWIILCIGTIIGWYAINNGTWGTGTNNIRRELFPCDWSSYITSMFWRRFYLLNCFRCRQGHNIFNMHLGYIRLWSFKCTFVNVVISNFLDQVVLGLFTCWCTYDISNSLNLFLIWGWNISLSWIPHLHQ